MYTILICDDDRDIVSALDIYLTSEGYQTLKAYNGREALRAAESHEIHLILASGPPPSSGRGAMCPSSCSPPKAKTRTKFWV